MNSHILKALLLSSTVSLGALLACSGFSEKSNESDVRSQKQALTASAWTSGATYQVGDRVSFEGGVYECIQAHTVHDPAWTPIGYAAGWNYIGVDDGAGAGGSGSGGSSSGGNSSGGSSTGGGVSLGADADRVMGFEAPVSDWTPTNGGVVTAVPSTLQGSTALGLEDATWSELQSVPVAWPGVSAPTTLGFDVKVLTPSPEPGWWGSVALTVSIPSAGISQWVGQQGLDETALDRFRRIEFQLPASLVTALSQPHSDVIFKIAVNRPATSEPYVIDRLSLMQEQEDPIVGEAPSVRIDDVLSFESLADWSVSSGTPALGTDPTDKEYALALTNVTYADIKTRVRLPSLVEVSDHVTVDVKLPSDHPNQWWRGSLGLSLHLPSQGMTWRWIASESLQSLSPGVWGRVQFQLPTDVRQALQAGYSDLQIQLSLNGPAAGEAYELDNIDFGQPRMPDTQGDYLVQIPLPVGATLEDVAIAPAYAASRTDELQIPAGSSGVRLRQTEVLGANGGFASVAQRTYRTNALVMEGGSEVGDVWSTTGLFLDQTSVVHGDSWLRAPTSYFSPAVRSPGADATGLIEGTLHTGQNLPWADVAQWAISSEFENNEIVLDGNGVLPPGNYGMLTSFLSAPVTLVSGEYSFKGMTLGFVARITLDNRNGPIIIRNDGPFYSSYATEVLILDRSVNNILIFHLSENTASFASFEEEGHWQATVVAPNAYVVINQGHAAPHHHKFDGAIYAKGVELVKTTLKHMPFQGEGCGQASASCTSALGCERVDTDRDSLADCEEERDQSPWTDPEVFNGVLASNEFGQNGCQFDFRGNCGLVDELPEIEACQTPGTGDVQKQYSGWSTTDITPPDLCFGPERVHSPHFNDCAPRSFAAYYQEWAVLSKSHIYAAESGNHCFQMTGEEQEPLCGSLFLDGAPIVPALESGTHCVELEAGVHPIAWFQTGGSNIGGYYDSYSLNYCFGGQGTCTATQSLPVEMLRPTYDGPTECGADECSPLCTCAEGKVCGTDNGGAFGLDDGENRCWDSICETEWRTVNCGESDSLCGECTCGNGVVDPGEACDTALSSTCRSDCAGSIDPNCAAFGSCEHPDPVGIPPGSCEAGCAEGLVCGHGNGDRFGYDSQVSMCWPPDHNSLDPSVNPCGEPSNAGQWTGFGYCPVCVPQCDGKSCGSDGCGGTCGTCMAGEICEAGLCNTDYSSGLSNFPAPPQPRPGLTLPTTELFDGAVPGGTKAEFSVNDRGEATYRIPLDVAPGRGGLAPSLALSYNSSGGNGPVGLGWSLDGLGQIKLCDHTVAQDGFTASPAHVAPSKKAFCLNGERLVLIKDGLEDLADNDELSQEFESEYRTENESFSRVTAYWYKAPLVMYPRWFKVETKDGRVLEFGRTTDSHIEGGGIELFGGLTWALNRVTDRAGNTMRVTYKTFGNEAGTSIREFFPETIIYGIHETESGASALASVKFKFEERPDSLEGWNYDTLYQLNHRLTEIQMSIATGAFRAYRLNYEQTGGDTGRSLVRQIQECATEPGTGSFGSLYCKKPIDFEYTYGTDVSVSDFRPDTGFIDFNYFYHTPFGGSEGPVARHKLDLNGDGYDDFLFAVSSFGQKEADCITDVTSEPHTGPTPDRGNCSAWWQALVSDSDGNYHSFATGVPIQVTMTGQDRNEFDPDTYPDPQLDRRDAAIWCSAGGYVADLDHDGDEELVETGCDSEAIHQTHYTVLDFLSEMFDPSNPDHISPYDPDAEPGMENNLDTAPLRRVRLENVPSGGIRATGIVDFVHPPYPDHTSDQFLLDYDGDGYQDLLICENAVSDNGGDLVLASRWTLHRHAGDQQPLSHIFGPGSEIESLKYVLCTPGLVVATAAQPPYDSVEAPASHHIIDVDGDGKDELLLRFTRGSESIGWEQRILSLSDSGGEVMVDEWYTDLPTIDSDQEVGFTPRMLDVNGDGLVDIIERSHKGLRVSLSRGSGKFDVHEQTYASISDWVHFLRGHAYDVDHDGRQDMVVVGDSQWVWYRSTGTVFEGPYAFSTPAPLAGGFFTLSANPIAADIDKDGLDELLLVHDLPGRWQVLDFEGPPHAELTRITDSLGAQTEVDYTSMKNEQVYVATAVACGVGQHCEKRSSRRVVQQSRYWHDPADQGAGVAQWDDHTYYNSTYHLPRQAWLGFRRHEVERSVNNYPDGAELIRTSTATYDHTTYLSDVAVYPYASDPEFVSTSVYRPGEKTVISTTETTFAHQLGGAGQRTFHPYAERVIEQEYEQSTLLDRVTTSRSTTEVIGVDQFGNPDVIRVTTDVGGADVFEFDLDYDLTQDRIDAWQINLVERETERHSVVGLEGHPMGSKTRTTLHEYFANGLLESTVREPNGSPTLQQWMSFERDDYGNITKVHEGSPSVTGTRTVEIVYDTAGFAPVEVTNAKGQTTDVLVDARFGSVTHVVDPNGLVSDIWFDSFGRERTQVDPDGNTVSWSYQFGPDDYRPLRIVQSVQGGENTLVEFDALGRARRSERTGLGGTFEQNRHFNARGYVRYVDRPHKTSLSNPEATTITTDNLGRPTEIQHPNGGETQICYRGRTTCSLDPLGSGSCGIVDNHGRVKVSVDWDESSYSCDWLISQTDALETDGGMSGVPLAYYQYGAFGDVVSVDSLNGGTKVIETDLWGRQTRLEDPDLGAITFAYNGLDEMVFSEDAEGNAMNFTYDVLGRILSRTENSTRTTQWFWDGDEMEVDGELIGTLTGTISGDGYTETYRYDEGTGRVEGVDRLMGEHVFSSAFTYDDFGRMETVSYPTAPGHDPVVLRQIYDSFGHVTEIADVGGSHTADGFFWKLDAASPTNEYEQLDTEHLGNAVRTTRTYGPNGFIQAIQSFHEPTEGAASEIQGLEYVVDLKGNILSRVNVLRDLRENFSYDRLDRLKCSRVTTATSGDLTCAESTYEYDELGRLMQKDALTYEYEASVKHAPSSVTWGETGAGDSFEYNDNGSRIKKVNPGGTTHYAYTAFNKPHEIWTEGASPEERLNLVSFEYGAHDEQIRKTTEASETIYFGGYERREAADGSKVEHIYNIDDGMRTVSQVTLEEIGGDSSTVYLHDDHIGSTHIITDEDGNVLDELSFDAFGMQRDATTWEPGTPIPLTNVTTGFTGHESEASLGLINMGGRMYDPHIGLFLQADPIVQAPYYTQSLNRYAYVFNNPLKLTDPTGYEGEAEGQSAAKPKPSTDPFFIPSRPPHDTKRKVKPSKNPGGGGTKNDPGANNPSNQTKAGDPDGIEGGGSPKDGGAGGGGKGDGDGSSDGSGGTGDGAGNGQGSKDGTDARDQAGSKEGDPSGNGQGSGKGGGTKGDGTGGPASPLQDAVAAAGVFNLDDIGGGPNASPYGIPGGMGPKENGSLEAQGLYLGGTAAGSGAGGGGFKALLRKMYKRAKKIAKDGMRSLKEMLNGLKSKKRGGQVTPRVQNAANHVFGPKSLAKHKLGGVLDAFDGDSVAAFNALEGAAQKLANKGAITGVFQTTVEVGGHTVTVRGMVVDGVAKVGTAFIP